MFTSIQAISVKTRLRRVVAVLALTSGVTHLAACVFEPADSRATALMLVMAAICMGCAGHLWVTGGMRTWLLTAVMYGGGLGAHALIAHPMGEMRSMPDGMDMMHAHGNSSMTGGEIWMQTSHMLMWVMLAVAVVALLGEVWQQRTEGLGAGFAQRAAGRESSRGA